jgi:hypothetical protein
MMRSLLAVLLFASATTLAGEPATSQPSAIDLANSAMQAYKSQASKDADEYHAALERLQSKLLVELKIAQKQAFRQESLEEVNDIQQMIDALPKGIDTDPTAAALTFDSTVFVCQASGAMLTVFPRLKEELMTYVGRLQPMQDFNIIVFHEDESDLTTLSRARLLKATADNKAVAGVFADRQGAMGGEDPIPAIRLAFSQHPDKIVLLTDRFSTVDSKQAIIDEFRRLNAGRKTKIDVLLWHAENY